MKKLWENFLNTLFPKKTSVIELEQMTQAGGLLNLPKSQKNTFGWAKALWQYSDPKVRTLVWEIKYQNNEILRDKVGEIIYEEILSLFEEKGLFAGKNWVITCIPASKSHLKDKGFNQTEKILEAIKKADQNNSFSYSPKILVKIRETKAQVKIKNRNERLKNLDGAFLTANPEEIVGRNFIVIDDVLTTGSTLKEAQRALKEAGAKKVLGFALAH